MSSYYLGDKSARCTTEKDEYPVRGQATANYENYVRSLFRPREKVQNSNDKSSAVHMLDTERHSGKDASDYSGDAQLTYDDDVEIDEGARYSSYPKYPVYHPKQSSEYYSIMYNNNNNNSRNRDDDSLLGANSTSNTSSNTSASSSARRESEENWKRNNRQMIIDYCNFDSSPLSPYMYQTHPYVQRNDTRIVGSNFVQITSRPRDGFLEKIDKTLADIRSSPRYA